MPFLTKFLLVASVRVRFKVSWYLLFNNCEHAIYFSSNTQNTIILFVQSLSTSHCVQQKPIRIWSFTWLEDFTAAKFQKPEAGNQDDSVNPSIDEEYLLGQCKIYANFQKNREEEGHHKSLALQVLMWNEVKVNT